LGLLVVSAVGFVMTRDMTSNLGRVVGAANAGALPAVSFLKASHFQDGHPGDSDPLDEQRFLVGTINKLQKLPEWSSMAVIVAWDDSDGWYDHVMGPIASPSADPAYDSLTGPGACGSPGPGAYQDRCGYGPRLPFLLISRYAKRNAVSHTTIDQTSILRFVEDNWGLPRIGDQSLDAQAGSIEDLFDYAHPRPASQRYLLSPSTGNPP
jgi:phospholipase C